MFKVENSARFERAKQKALAVRPHISVCAFGEYFVDGTSSVYAVSIAEADGEMTIDCNCLAGQNEKPCYHAAAALVEHTKLAVVAQTTPAAARDRNLASIEHDLRFIARRAGDMTTDFELMQEILMAVRGALRSLDEYELSFPPVAACAQAA